MDPVPVEPRHPLLVFPAEMWSEILGYLPLKDLHNVMQAHPYLAIRVEQDYPNLRFQLVLPILAQKIAKRQQKMSFDPHRMYVPTADLLNLRLVCNGWNKVVQYYFQNEVYAKTPFIAGGNLTTRHFEVYGLFTRGPRQDISFDGRIFSEVLRQPGYYRRWLQSTFISHPPGTATNPFLSRHCVGFLGIAPEHVRDIEDTLVAYGHHLLRMGIYGWTFVPPQQHYDLLRSCLAFTPNLVKLSVSAAPIKEGHLVNKEELIEFQNSILAHPLPDLPQLRELDLIGLSIPIQNALLEKYQERVEELHLQPHPRLVDLFQSLPLHALKKLQLSIHSRPAFISLARFHNPPCPQLETLEVDFTGAPTNAYVNEFLQPSAYSPSWNEIIRLLNQMFSQAPSLRKLMICAPLYNTTNEGAILRDTHEGRLELQQVQQLKIRVVNPLICMDFILPMKDSLQKLAVDFWWRGGGRWDFPRIEKVDFNEEIEWNDWLERKLLRSNLWDLFPNLSFVRIEASKGWTYRRRQGTPVFVYPDGKEEDKDEVKKGAMERIRAICPLM